MDTPFQLFRFGDPGNERPGIRIAEKLFELPPEVNDFNEEFFHNQGIDLLAILARNSAGLKPLPENIRMGPPIARPSKIICVGLNYRRHALESKMKLPSEPIIFFKSTTAICGPNDNLVIPPGSEKTDYEVELAVVIGKTARYVSEAKALNHVAGFCLHNDYSERAYQLEREGQWVKGKSCDTFAPLGPWLVPTRFFPEYQHQELWLSLNGEMRQQESTADMIFSVPFLVSYISQFMTLLPGDVISTGTPPGVGLGMDPQVYIKEGDVISLGGGALGKQTQLATAFHEN